MKSSARMFLMKGDVLAIERLVPTALEPDQNFLVRFDRRTLLGGCSNRQSGREDATQQMGQSHPGLPQSDQ